MGVRHRNKGSPPSTPSSVYSGSRQSSSLEEGVLEPGLTTNKTTRERRQTPRSRTSFKATSALVITLFVIMTISSFSFLLTFSAIQGHASMRSLQGNNHQVPKIPTMGKTRGKPHFPRLVFLDGPAYSPSVQNKRTVDDEFLHVTESTQPEPSEKAHLQDCIPLADWMTDSYPNCNAFHELSLPKSIHHWNSSMSTSLYDDQLHELGRGWFRNTWQWDRLDESIVLKTLRIEREFLNEYYDLHNRDALAMERLTASPNVVDVYGYCGQSAINELADFPIENMQCLEKLSRRMRGMYDHDSLFLRLGIATNIARGLADVHRAGGDGRPLMVHYDINPRNVALFRGARPKINDFNIAEFLYYNPHTNKTCGFPSRMHAPWWRAPEELDLEEQVLLDEKVDVYSLGSTLFHLFTSFSPRGKMISSREEIVREWVREGKKPVIHPILRNSTDSIAATFREVLDRCHEFDPSKRASSEEIAEILESALKREKEAMLKGANHGSGGKTDVSLASSNENESDDEDQSAANQKG